MNRLSIVLLIGALVAGFVWLLGGEESGEAANKPVSKISDFDPDAEPRANLSGEREDREQVGQTAGRTVAGRVIGPDDEPVVAASVTIFEILSPWPGRRLQRIHSAYSGDDGSFRFEVAKGIDVLVEVVHDGLARKRIVVPTAVRDLPIRMTHGFEVAGFVLDIPGNIVRGCDVYLEPGTWGSIPAQRTKTDGNGQFRFSHVPAGLVRITARSEPYQPISAPMFTVGSSGRVHLRFQYPAHPTRGRVVEAAAGNAPIAGAEVRVYPGSWNGRLYVPFTAVTDGNGEFRMRGLGTSNLRFEVHHPDYSVASRGVSVRDSVPELSFELVARSAVRGQLNGEGVEGLVVRVQTDVGEMRRATVGADGSFAFDGLSAGAAELEIAGGLRALRKTSNRLMTFMIDEAVETRLELNVIAPAVVRGRVVDTASQPVPNVTVSTPKSIRRNPDRIVTATDANGEFELLGLVPGTARLGFEHDDYASGFCEVTVSAAGETVEAPLVSLVPAGRIEGRVVRDGLPRPGATVFVGTPRRTLATVSGPDGRYVLRGLSPGRYRVKARYSTLPFVNAAAIEVNSGVTTKIDDIAIQSGRRITGTVQDPAGRPIADALVYVPGTLSKAIHTDTGGTFEIDVDGDATELLIFSSDFTTSVTESVTERRTRLLVELPIITRSTIKARVRGLPSRRPVTTGVLRVEALDRGSPSWDPAMAAQRDVERIVKMPNGVLMADWVPIGNSRLVLQCQGYAPYTTTVDIRSGSQFDAVDLGSVLLEPGAEVHGRVVDDEGRPIQGADVFLGGEADMFKAGFRSDLRTDADGRFKVAGVTHESRTLVVHRDRKTTVVRELRIPADLLRSADRPLEIEMKPCSRIRVTVLDASGKPTDSRIVLLHKGYSVLSEEVPDADGSLKFVARGPGEYRVELFGEDVVQTVEVGAEPDIFEVTLRSEK